MDVFVGSSFISQYIGYGKLVNEFCSENAVCGLLLSINTPGSTFAQVPNTILPSRAGALHSAGCPGCTGSALGGRTSAANTVNQDNAKGEGLSRSTNQCVTKHLSPRVRLQIAFFTTKLPIPTSNSNHHLLSCKVS